jgi:hypothetical protein
MSRSSIGAVVAAVVVLVAPVAHAAPAESPVVRFNAKDQAAARSAVLKAGDLGSGWKGGFEKAKVSSPTACPGLWDPKQADLVITGLAESSFSYRAGATQIASAVQLYETSAMTALDWKRTVVHPAIPRCVAKQAAADEDESFRLVSFKRTPFPKLATYSARFRMVIDYTVDGGKTVRVLSDSVVFGRGRTAATLTVTAPYADRAAAHGAELRLARLMLARLPT